MVSACTVFLLSAAIRDSTLLSCANPISFRKNHSLVTASNFGAPKKALRAQHASSIEVQEILRPSERGPGPTSSPINASDLSNFVPMIVLVLDHRRHSIRYFFAFSFGAR